MPLPDQCELALGNVWSLVGGICVTDKLTNVTWKREASNPNTLDLLKDTQRIMNIMQNQSCPRQLDHGHDGDLPYPLTHAAVRQDLRTTCCDKCKSRTQIQLHVINSGAWFRSMGASVVSQTRETLRHAAAAQHKCSEHWQCYMHFMQHAVRYTCVARTRALEAMTSTHRSDVDKINVGRT